MEDSKQPKYARVKYFFESSTEIVVLRSRILLTSTDAITGFLKEQYIA
jgi:hypothetical protein